MVSIEKKMHNMRAVIWGKMRTVVQETAFLITLRNRSEWWAEVAGQVLVKGKYLQSSTYFLQEPAATHKEQLSPWKIFVLFSVWGDAGTGLINWFLKTSKYLETCSVSNSGAQRASFRLSTLSSSPWWGCWKSAAAAAHGLILVEVDGKCQFVVGNGKHNY